MRPVAQWVGATGLLGLEASHLFFPGKKMDLCFSLDFLLQLCLMTLVQLQFLEHLVKFYTATMEEHLPQPVVPATTAEKTMQARRNAPHLLQKQRHTDIMYPHSVSLANIQLPVNYML